MSSIQTRLFTRLIGKSKEVYLLKIVTLAIAFSCSTLIVLFSLNEFGYDRFHEEHVSVFRLLQRNNNEVYIGNRFSNKIPTDVFDELKSINRDSLIISRIKLLDDVIVVAGDRSFSDSKFHATDPDISQIFTFKILTGSLKEFYRNERTVLLSSTATIKYFGTVQSIGKSIRLCTLGDTTLFTVAAVYEDYPQNSHEEFNTFIRFDTASIQSMRFNPKEFGIYGKLFLSRGSDVERIVNELQQPHGLTYKVQPITQIYFGPRVAGEDSKHGDLYSIIILVCITTLILFLSLASFINLTTLTLPYRSKELAVKKLAGTSHSALVIAFAKESILVTGASLILGLSILAVTSGWLRSILGVDVAALFLHGDLQLIIILIALFAVVSIAPLFLTLRFVKATPNRLLSPEPITFPRLKKTIMFVQLGISIFLIVASMVIKRQINYSLLKEPGRNYDQIVFVRYPEYLTNEGLASMRTAWKQINANVVDLMATSHLPDRITSKELNSEFYFFSVDRGFKDFFQLEIIQGHWFKPNDGDSIVLVNEQGNKLTRSISGNVIGVFKDMSGQFNQPEKPIKINAAQHFNYNYLCIRILEVDIRRTVEFLERHFEENGKKATVSFLDRRFEEWLKYQDKLNTLSEILAIISGVLSCSAVYGLSVSVVRDKLHQIAIHKLFGASTLVITWLLIREFGSQMLWATAFFGALTYIILREILRTFVYSTKFIWSDPIVPVAYCAAIIALLCFFQTLSLNRNDLTSALKR